MTKDFVKDAATCIITQAIEDWQSLMRVEKDQTLHPEKMPERPRRITNEANFEEIRLFFRSGYGDELCWTIDLDASKVLAALENMLSEQRKTYEGVA